jgi:pimeloyl-ACP methyl ester carboxylesterase
MFVGFATHLIKLEPAPIFARVAGNGPPLLLLHGFPETHLMWRDIAPLLTPHFTVVCADLRGYGQSGTPPSAPDHAPYSKRAMADDMIRLMAALGFERFMVAGHDRGGRVAYRMALDHPGVILKSAVLDIVSTADAWDRADARFALAFWPWSLLAQPAPLPEQILGAAPRASFKARLAGGDLRRRFFQKPFAPAMKQCSATPIISTQYARSTEQPQRLTTNTICWIARRESESSVRSWPFGAVPGRSLNGTPMKAVRSRSGGRGARMSRDDRSRVATFSLRNIRPRPPGN